MHNWMAMGKKVFLNEHLNQGSAGVQFLDVSTARIVVISLQGHWMKREVNECGECAGPLWLCVSLISNWWEAVWGRDGAYYCYGTLRTLWEALLCCLFCGQQCSRYKHSKQQLKGNQYSKKKPNRSCTGIISCKCYQAERVGHLELFSCHRYFSSSTLTLLHILHLLDWIFYSVSSLCSLLYTRHTLLSFSISVTSSVRCFLSGSLCEELGRRVT